MTFLVTWTHRFAHQAGLVENLFPIGNPAWAAYRQAVSHHLVAGDNASGSIRNKNTKLTMVNMNSNLRAFPCGKTAPRMRIRTKPAYADSKPEEAERFRRI